MLTIRMKHFWHKSNCWGFVWIFLCKLNCKFESSILKWRIMWPKNRTITHAVWTRIKVIWFLYKSFYSCVVKQIIQINILWNPLHTHIWVTKMLSSVIMARIGKSLQRHFHEYDLAIIISLSLAFLSHTW